MIFKLALNDIESGIKGENKGLSIGLPRLEEYVPGIQPATNYLIGGETGSGKSMFGINNFIYTPYEDYIKNYKNSLKLKIFIISCEMSKSALGARAISRKLYLDYGIIADTNYVLSRGKHKISTEIYSKVKQLSEYFEEMEDYVEIFPSLNPTGIRNTVLQYVNNNGVTHNKIVETIDGDKEVFDYYTPNNKQLIMCLVDHVSIIKKELGFNKKEKIDKLFEYEIQLRDMFNVSFINIQQLNRNISSTDRFKLGSVEPQLSDYKDSGDSTDACNYVIAIFSPQRYEISPYRDYLINTKDGGIGDRFRSIKLLKNREGVADKILGTMFLGESGIIKELPKSDLMTRDIYDSINKLQKVK